MLQLTAPALTSAMEFVRFVYGYSCVQFAPSLSRSIGLGSTIESDCDWWLYERTVSAESVGEMELMKFADQELPGLGRVCGWTGNGWPAQIPFWFCSF